MAAVHRSESSARRQNASRQSAEEEQKSADEQRWPAQDQQKPANEQRWPAQARRQDASQKSTEEQRQSALRPPNQDQQKSAKEQRQAAEEEQRGSTSSGRGRLLSLTKYIPYPSVTHAGGQYVLAHVRALGEFVDIELLAPDIPLNREALPLAQASDGPPASLINGAHLDGPALTFWRVESVWAGSSIYLPIRRLFRENRAPWAKLEAADAVELQWSEMVALAPLIKRRLPHKPLIGVAHDVITQRLDRQAEGARPGNVLRRALLRLAARRARRRESRSFGAVDLLIVFSEKDAVLARELAPGTRVQVVHPGLGPTDPRPRSPHLTEPMVLFTGAMNRPENWRGVAWFIDEMWSDVLAAVPHARLVIAGANPPKALSEKVAATPRAVLTGFVDSLEPFYAEASVFIAALQSGAGVKFKTIDAMLRGVPIVATSVGVEGIDAMSAGDEGIGAASVGVEGVDATGAGVEGIDATSARVESIDASDLFAAVTDDAASFAKAVIAQLEAPDEALALKAQRWAESVYGVAAFERRIRELYADVIK